MGNFMVVAVLNGFHDNFTNIPGFSLGIFGFLNESIQQFSSRNHFQDQVNKTILVVVAVVIVITTATVKNIVQSNDVIVFERAKDFDFLFQTFLVEFFHFWFGNDFNGVRISGLFVVPKPDHGKHAPSELKYNNAWVVEWKSARSDMNDEAPR